MSNEGHQSVLADEVISFFQDMPGKRKLFLDCTLGGGGHAKLLLDRIPEASLLGIDKDSEALLRASKHLKGFGERVKFLKANFSEIGRDLLYRMNVPGNQELSGVMADLGISSYQLDSPERGFSFRHRAHLDMRMDQGSELTADQVLNRYSVEELYRVFVKGGVGKDSSRLARAVVNGRPIVDTLVFAQVCSRILGRRLKHQSTTKKNPATVPFQAVRMEVNSEIDSLKGFLPKVLELLVPGGRIAIISFHSIEDRFVTKAFRQWEQGESVLHRAPMAEIPSGLGRLLTKRAVVPSAVELERNPRARSARLRVFEKF